MRAAGMQPYIDPVGNVRGFAAALTATGTDVAAPSMFVGSHYDSVVDGGHFDGAMGIICGIAAVKALILETALTQNILSTAQLEAVVAELTARHETGSTDVTLSIPDILPENAPMPLLQRPIQVVGFSDEEGVRFQSTFLGSQALAGSLVDSGALLSLDEQGFTLLDALKYAGMEGTVEALEKARLPPGVAAGYVEVHLEQGPVLETFNRAVGVVRGIAGQSRMLISVLGEQGHAGTVPMLMRHDPLAGATEMIFEVERYCKDITEKLKAEGGDDSLVCTVGSLSVWPGAVNVIPGSANFTLDVRCQTDAVRAGVLRHVRATVRRTCTKRKLICSVELRHDVGAVPCSKDLVMQLAQAVERSERKMMPRLNLPVFRSTPEPECDGESGGGVCAALPESDFVMSTVKMESGAEVPILASGAGHDGMAMSEITPIGMLFVRCRGGISHSPAEWVEPVDVASGVSALVEFLRGWEGQKS